MSDRLFYIEIQDASGNAVGDRPIQSAIRVSRKRSLDKIGGLQFSLPAIDPATQYIRTGRRFVVRHRRLGNLGTFIYKNERLTIGDPPILNIDCWDDLKELVDTNVLLFREYSAQAVDVVVSALLALASGWSDGDVETGIGTTTVSYHGESVFTAIDALRDRWGRHYRRGTTAKTLDFGAFGTDSGVRLIKPAALGPDAEDDDQVAFVTSLEVAEESEPIFNSLFALGFGEGKAQLDLETADQPASTTLASATTAGDTALTLTDASSFSVGDILYIDDAGSLEALEITAIAGSVVTIDPAPNETGLYYAHVAGVTVYASYKVLSTTNADGSTLYYIEDSTSVRLYAAVQRPFVQSGIRPISNTVANITNAANALRITASYFLKRNRFPRVTYAVEVTKLRDTDLKPGDKVRLQYRGIASVPGESEYKWVDVDTLHYVMDIEEIFDDGTESARLELSETGHRRTADSDVTLGLAREIQIKAIHPGTYTFEWHDTRLELIDSSTDVTIPIDIDDYIWKVRSVKLRLKTAPLRATATAAQSATHTHSIGASGGHTHTVNVGAGGAHTHTVNVGAGGAHTHTVNVGAGGGHVHAVNVGAGGGHVHAVNVGAGGSHTHDITGKATDAGAHLHGITLGDSESGNPVYYGEATLRCDGGGAVATGTEFPAHTHDIDGVATDAQTHTHPGETAETINHTHPGETAETINHTHPGQTAASNTHTHPGETAESNTHTHAGETTESATHVHEIGASGGHTHNLTYGISEETGVRPDTVRIAVDGVDRTAALGGPWGVGGGAVNEELDITTYIVDSALGLRVEHSVVISCDSSQGRIETILRAVMDAQSIAVS